MTQIPLKANFEMSSAGGNIPLTVNFTNLSDNFINSEWTFGDGATSNLINPTHTYTEIGSYDVKLKVSDNENSLDEMTKRLSVTDNDDEDTVFFHHNLYVYKRFNPGHVSITSRNISGTTFETQYPFSGVGLWNLNGDNDVGVYDIAISASSSENIIVIDNNDILDNDAFSAYCHTTHDDDIDGFLMIPLSAGSVTDESWNDHFTELANIQPIQVLKITGVTMPGAVMSLESDRTSVFRREGVGVNKIRALAIVRPTSGSTIGYDSYNSRFLHTNFAVDSRQNFETTGITYVDNSYLGTLSYFGLDNDPSGNTLTISTLPYSGYEASDKLTPGTFLFNIPWIMWHKNKSDEGVTLRDVYGNVEFDEVTNLKFKYLRDGITMDDNIVGKIFYDKKTIAITDKELNAALMFQSNRNWTLPEPRILDGGADGDSSTETKYYITYAVRDEENTNFTATTSHGYNYSESPTNPMHCAYIKGIIPSANDRQFKIEVQDSPWKASDITKWTGFSQDHIAIIIGTGTTGSTYADSNSWKISACTTTSSLSSALLIPNYSDFSTKYKWGSNLTFDKEEFPIGSQSVGFGYMSGAMETTIYKLVASCVGRGDEFNSTQNKTYNVSENDNIYITEVGIYNEDNELLLIGKLNKPFMKNSEKYITVKVELDF